MKNQNCDPIQEKITELMGHIRAMPEPQRSRLMELARQTQLRHEQLRDTFGKLHEGLDHLRLHVKYLMFDLDATRRENAQLRRLLKERQ